jgi:hypothetical protein
MVSSSDNPASDSNGTTEPVAAPRKTSAFRTTTRVVVWVGLGVAIVGALFGLLPPWPVIVALLVGLISTVAFIASGRPRIGAACAAVAIFVSCWFLRSTVDIRAATADDRLYDRYFGFEFNEPAARDVKITNFFVATSTFTLDTWVSANLYHVKSGKIEDMNGFVVGRSPNQIGAPHWVDMKITFALSDLKTPQGRETRLGSAGHSRGGGHGYDAHNDAESRETKVLPGRFTSGARRIVYVEGNSGFRFDDSMTVEQFAQENSGNYLVVEVGLN